jgi:antiviral helicase SLH1
MVDAMNAEISLGTVATVRDAISWLRYTYLFVRMQKNPFLHGGLSLRAPIMTLIVAWRAIT